MYTDPQGHYPQSNAVRNATLVSFPSDAPRSIDIMWQDLVILKLGITSIEDAYYGESGRDARITVELSSCIEPAAAAVIQIREGASEMLNMGGIGKFRIGIDRDANRNMCLAELKIDFDQSYLNRTVQRVFEPMTKEGNDWVVLKPKIIGRKDRQEEQRKCEFVITMESPDHTRHRIGVAGRMRRVFDTLVETIYEEQWEYWPDDFPPSNWEPKKIVRGKVASRSVKRARFGGLSEPFAGGEIIFTIAELKGHEGFVWEGALTLDANGRGSFDLTPYSKAANVLADLTVTFMAKDDPERKELRCVVPHDLLVHMSEELERKALSPP